MSRYVIRNNDLPGDTVAINAEPGMKLPNGKETSAEFVVNSNATAMFGPILEKMNKAVPRHYSKNNFALGQEGKAHEAINMVMVKSFLSNMGPQDNSPVKMEANEFATLPIADSPVRQRVDATRQMQEGGSVDLKSAIGGGWSDPHTRTDILTKGDQRIYKNTILGQIPAELVGGEGGSRYYIGEGTSKAKSAARSKAKTNLTTKMFTSPADSIPQAMIGDYFPEYEQEEAAPVEEQPRKKGRLRGLLGLQEGGPAEEDYFGKHNQLDWDGSKARSLREINLPEGGSAYYLGEADSGAPNLSEQIAMKRAKRKAYEAPQDSIPRSMVEGYFNEPSKVSGFLKRLGINKQDGGEVEEGRSVRDYLGSLQGNYQKYQGDVMTEAGDSKFNPSGQLTREGLAEEHNFPLEEAQFDTLYGYGTPGAAININVPNRKMIEHRTGNVSEKDAEMRNVERNIQDQMTKEHEGSYASLRNMLGGDYSEAIEAEEAGYLDMDYFDQLRYDRDKKKSGGYQQGGPVYGYENGGQVKSERQAAQDSLMNTDEYDDIKAENAKQLQMMAMLDSLNQGGGENVRTPEGGGVLSDDGRSYSPSLDERFNMWEQTGQGVESSRARQLRMAKVPADNYSGEDVVKNMDSLKHYFRSFGRLKTPLQERNEFLYNRLGVDPENPPMQLQGLKGRALLQRYGNEVQ